MKNVTKIKNQSFAAFCLSSGIEDMLLQQFLLSSLYSFDSIFFSYFGLISCILVMQKFVSMFNKETGKRQFLTFHVDSYKERKNASSVTRIL